MTPSALQTKASSRPMPGWWLACLLAASGLAAAWIGLLPLSPGVVRAERPLAEANLRLTLSGPPSAAAGAQLGYRLVLTNTGGASAPGTQVTLTLPAALDALDASLAYDEPSPGVLVWTPGDLPVGAVRQLTLTVRVRLEAADGPLPELVAETRGTFDEAELSDNRAELPLELAPTDLRLLVASEQSAVQPGDLVTHTVTIVNVSRQAAAGLIITASLSGADWQSDTATAPENGFTRRLLPGGPRWERAALPGPWTAHIDLVTRVPQDAPAGALVRHALVLSAVTRDARSSDDRVSTAPIAVAMTDLFVRLTGPGRAAPDDGVEYTLSYGNRGPGEVRETRITDTLPAGMAFVSASPPASLVGDRTLVWRTGRLRAGAEDIIRVQARLLGGLAAGSLLESRAEIGMDAPDLAPADNVAATTTEVVPGRPAGLELSLAEVLPVDGRARVEARVRDAFGNLVTEPVTLSFSSTGGSFVPAQSASVGGLATTTFVAGPLPGDVAVTVRLGALRADASLRLEPADLSLAGMVIGPGGPVASSQLLPGDPITYTLDLRNTGLATARGVVLATAFDLRLLPRGVQSRVAVTETALPPGLLDLPEGYSLRAWQLPDLAAGARISLTLPARIDPAPDQAWTGFDPVFLRSAVKTTTAERGQPDLVHTQKLDVHAADLFAGLSLNGLASSIRPGGQLVYDLSFGNGEAALVDGASITFTLPISTSFDHWMPLAGASLEPDPDSLEAASSALIWRISGPVPTTGGLRLWLDVDEDAPAEQLLQAQLRIGSPVYDVNPGNDSAVDLGAWLRGVNLSSQIQAPATGFPGQSLSGRIELHNAALRDTAENVVLRAELPPGLRLLRSEPAAASGPDGSLRWTLERPLAAGASAFFDLDLALAAELAPGTRLRLTVEAASSSRESYIGDNLAAAEILVVPGPPARIELAAERLRLVACAEDSTRITARILDAQGNPVADGSPITWSSEQGRLSSTSGISAGGLATVTLTAGTRTGAAELRASAGDATAALELAFDAGPPGALGVSARPATVANDGTTRVTVLVSDACANPVADGWPITLSAERGRWANGASRYTLPSTGGRVEAILSVGRVAGTLRVSASHAQTQGEAQISVDPAPTRWDIYLPFSATYSGQR
ncbi:MAG: DUF11 domain-containing protein [Chloroflexi bacterium]|nr:DUF11 domain-containing protein [Chloroflexota bacterium]